MNLPDTHHTAAVPPSLFVTTRWSVVLAAQEKSSPDSAAALETLCRAYWYPLCAYVRSSGHAPHDAHDLTQEFFARLLAKDYLQAADREKGRCRTFLRVRLKRFLANEWDRQRAAKRGGGARPPSTSPPPRSPWRIALGLLRAGRSAPHRGAREGSLRESSPPPVGPLPAKAHRSWVGTLFEFHQPGGAEYRASLNVTPPVTSADPNWAAASSAMPYYNESGVNMNWLVEASQPGTVRFSRGSSRSSTLLQLDAKT